MEDDPKLRKIDLRRIGVIQEGGFFYVLLRNYLRLVGIDSKGITEV